MFLAVLRWEKSTTYTGKRPICCPWDKYVGALCCLADCVDDLEDIDRCNMMPAISDSLSFGFQDGSAAEVAMIRLPNWPTIVRINQFGHCT